MFKDQQDVGGLRKDATDEPRFRVAEIDRTPALTDDRAKVGVLRRKQSHEAPGDLGNCRRGSFEQPLEIGVEGRRFACLCFHDLTFVRSLARFWQQSPTVPVCRDPDARKG